MNRVFVVEVSPTTSADGSTSTFLFSTEAFATRPGDTPTNTPVRALLKNPGTVRRELFSGARVTGAITPSYGNIVLANPAPVDGAAGELDGWIDYGISGSRVVVRWGEIGDAYPAEWTTVYIAYAHSMVADTDSITIRLRDRLQLLDKPVVNEAFTGAGGIEGNGGVSKRKQFVSQDPGLIPPILVDANRLIYFVQSTGAGSFYDMYLWNAVDINAFDVFDNGVEITREQPNYSTPAEMLSQSPSEGSVRYWFGTDSTAWPGAKNGPVYFRLGSPPDGDVRVFASGYPNDDDAARLGATYGSHTAGTMALRAGLVAADLDDSAHTLNMLQQLIDDDRTYLDALADAALCTQGFFGFTRLDKFRSGYLLDPESRWYYYGITPGVIGSGEPTLPTTSLYTFTQDNTTRLRREPPAGMEAPVWSVTIGAGETWPSQIAGGATPEMKDYLTREPFWTSVQGVSTTALLANPGAISASVELRPRMIENQFAARLTVERYFALYGGRRDFFTFTVPMADDVLALELHDVVTLQTPRFGLSAGKKYRIVGITLDCSAKVPSIKFTLWGGETGRYTGHTGGPGTPGYQPPGSTPTPSAVLTAARNSIGDFTGWMVGTVSTSSGTGTPDDPGDGSALGGSGGRIGDFTGYMVGTVADPVGGWNPADVSSNNAVTFTDSSYTVAGGSPITSGRGTVSHTTGKRYFEILVVEADVSGMEVGIKGSGALSNSSTVATDTNQATCSTYNNVVWIATNFLSGFGGISEGDTIGVAVEVGVRVDFYTNNSFNKGAAFTESEVWPFFCTANGSNEKITLRTKAVDFTYTPPTGYTGWED